MLKKIFKKEAAKPPVLSNRSTVLANGLEIDCLPEDLLKQIFSYLGPEDLCAFCRVNELWRSVVEEDVLWRRHMPTQLQGVYRKDTPLKRIYKDELVRNGPRPPFKPYVAKGIEHQLLIQDLYDALLSSKKGLNWRQYAFRVRHYGMNRMTYIKDVFGDDSPDDTIVARRSDTLVRMYCRELVPGDIVELRPGDHVPADIRLIRGDGLLLDRSFLTGDLSVMYAHPSAVVPPDGLMEDARNCALLGCTVLAGTCTGMVVGVGNQTYIGRLSFAVQQERVQAFRARTSLTGGSRPRNASPAMSRSPSDAVALTAKPSAGARTNAPEKTRPPNSPAEVKKPPATAPQLTALKTSSDFKAAPRKGTKTDEMPDIRNKKMFPLLNKVSTLIIDAETLYTNESYAITATHCDAITVAVTPESIEKLNNAPSGKTVVLLTEGLSIILAMTAPLASEDPTRHSATELLESHTNEHLRALGNFARVHGNVDAALSLATWRCAHQVWSEQEHFTSLLYMRKKKPEVLVLGTPERVLSTCNKQIVDGKETSFDWKERMKTVHELRERHFIIYALISYSRLEETENHLNPNVVMEKRRMCFVGLVCLSRVANPQTQQVLAKIRESETKLIVLFSSGVDNMKNLAVQCGSPILFDCMRHCKDKPMEIENPLEVDPVNRSILVNFMSLTKEQLRPIFAYDRIFMPRMGAAMKEQLVQYLKETGETVAIHAVGMNDVIGSLAADIVVCPANAPMLIYAQSSVILPSREQVHFVNLFEAIKSNNGNKCSIQ